MIPSTFIGYITRRRKTKYIHTIIVSMADFGICSGNLIAFYFLLVEVLAANHKSRPEFLDAVFVCVLEEINGTFFFYNLSQEKQRRLHGPGNFLQTPFIAASIFFCFFFFVSVCVCLYASRQQ